MVSLLAGSCTIVATAQAHALLDRSEPAAGVVLAADQAPKKISLWFSEPVQPTFNSIAVLDSDNKRVDRLDANTSPDDPTRIDVDVGDLPQGSYLVRWRAVSADTHVVRGSFWFVVGFAATPPPEAQLLGTGTPVLSPLEIVTRWLSLLALLALTGTSYFRLAVLRPMRITAPSFEPAIIMGATALYLVTQICLAALQAEAVAELPLPQALTGQVLGEVLFDSRFGLLWWLRLLLGALLGILCYRRTSPIQAVLVALLLLIVTSLAGHASGARVMPALAIAVDSAHLIAAALWIGTLLQLSLMLPRLLTLPRQGRFEMLSHLVPRVSLVLLPTVAILFATGVFSAWEQVGTLDALLSTAHGQSLVVKLALTAPLLAIAAINLLLVRPRIGIDTEKTPRRFLTNVRAEMALATAILLSVAVLGTLPPSAQQTFPEPLEIARQAGDLRVSFKVDPVWVGVSRFEVQLADDQDLPPADVRQVVLTFTMEGMNMGRTTVTMTHEGNGRYALAGFYIGMPGIAQIGVAIGRASGDRTAVFRIEVPDMNPQQLAGLAAVLGARDNFPGIDGAEVPADAASLAHGKELYEANCLACHGETGIGNGPAAASLLPPPADLTLHARWHSSEQLNWFIANGVPGSAMVAFADQLAPNDRWDVVNYLHALSQAPTATAARPPPVTRGQLAPEASSAEGPILNGRMVFGPDFDNNLWVVDLPEGKPRPLLKLDPKEVPSNPSWSPDGTQIAFSYYRLPENAAIPVPDGTDLYVMNADGSGMRPLWQHGPRGEALQYPAWSADGSAIYVSRAAPGGGRSIDRVDVQSGEHTRVLPDAAFPALSPDGQWLADIRYPIPPDRGESLWISKPDGSEPKAIIAPAVFEKFLGVRFSPDGTHLVFAAVGRPSGTDGALPDKSGVRFGSLFGISPAHANGDIWDMWIIDIDGKNLRPMTALSEDMPVAAFSPDGKSIAFLGGGSASTAEAGVTVVPTATKELKRLTTQPGHRGFDWTGPREVGTTSR